MVRLDIQAQNLISTKDHVVKLINLGLGCTLDPNFNIVKAILIADKSSS